MRRTTCETCGATVNLDTSDDVFDGGECPGCGAWVTRYIPGQAPA